ncbi:RHS repeat-associated core domain-containing protein [Pseudomonas sp. NPDC089392]|uniref:RHS repeat-associated core domain-containing protein n=1 Tax=Pseudomonas sp. NPDC089392 TaxID=3364459 RepID=UPI00382AE422
MKNHILLFYSRKKLAVLKGTHDTLRIVQALDLPLAESKAAGVALVAPDQRQTPVMIGSRKTHHSFAFTPFGHIPTAISVSIGFVGERLDLVSGCYPLGAGHRSYSPELMRFHSPDSQSPFLSGGVNTHAYCSNDPVNYSDPSGRVKLRNLWKGPQSLIHSTFRGNRNQSPAQPTLPPYSPAAPGAVVTGDGRAPPTYFGWGEPPPQYDPHAPLMSNGNQTRSYRVTPMNGEQVLEMHNGNTRVVNSLVEFTQASAQAGNRALPAAASLKATSTLLRMSKNKLPTQTDNGILAAVATAHQLYDIRGAGTMDAPDPTQSLPLAIGITRQT